MGCAPITRLALLLMLVVAATGQASAAVAADGRVGVATLVARGGVPSASATPLKASFQPVASRAVTATISAARGGTLTLSAPRGMRIVVRIPSRALLADTKVTATPITRFRVAPVHGGFVVGVQLAPEGLELLKPGSVEFRARKGLRPTRRYFLGSQGNGSDVHLVPPAFRKVGQGRKAKLRVVSKPIVPILHFSTVEGFDWSKTNLRDLDDIRYPQSPLDQVAQNLAKLLGVERHRQLFGFEASVDLLDRVEGNRALPGPRDQAAPPGRDGGAEEPLQPPGGPERARGAHAGAALRASGGAARTPRQLRQSHADRSDPDGSRQLHVAAVLTVRAAIRPVPLRNGQASGAPRGRVSEQGVLQRPPSQPRCLLPG